MNYIEKYLEIVPNATSFEKEVMQELASFIIQEAVEEERERVGLEIDRMIADELSAKPVGDVEKTAEWYRISGLQELRRKVRFLL